MRAFAHDISVPEYVAGAKALGLISRHITGPLWSLLENKSIHILEMNENYLQLVNFVLDPSQSIEAVMTGDPLVFGNRTIVKRDAIYDSLIQPWDHDDKVVVYLSILLPVIREVSKRLFKYNLPGGCWENVTEDMKEKSRGTSKHNKFAESVFGYLDQLMRKNPNMSILASEAYIMFTSNKTKQWLDAKSEEEKKYLVEDAMKVVPNTREAFKEKREEIKRKQREALNEKMKKEEEKEAKRIERLEKKTDKIIFFGLWQTREDVDRALASIQSVTEKKEALKAQLNFRRYVLLQKPPKEGFENVFNFSFKENGKIKQCNIEQLAAKRNWLVMLIAYKLQNQIKSTIPFWLENMSNTSLLIRMLVKSGGRVKLFPK